MNAQEYATKCHKETNHLYGDGLPYYFHLKQVYDTAHHFKFLIPEDKWETIFAACWCHDIIEDCRQTYNDVKQNTSIEVAEIVYALTNEKGKNRAERANDKYYAGIKNIPYADFVKLCDRIANVNYSTTMGSSMINAYRKENDKFVGRIGNNYPDMIARLNQLLTNQS